MASLSLRHVYKKYPGGVVAVSDFNLEIKDKEFIIGLQFHPEAAVVKNITPCALKIKYIPAEKIPHPTSQRLTLPLT